MNNQEIPIKQKTPERILAIAKAKSVKSYDLSKSKFTEFWETLDEKIKNDFEEFVGSKNELGYLLYSRDAENWTLLTSHKLVGRKNGKLNRVKLQEIRNRDFGIVKNMDNIPLILKVNTRLKNLEFEYESNGPGFALMVSLDFIQNHWERNAINENVS